MHVSKYEETYFVFHKNAITIGYILNYSIHYYECMVQDTKDRILHISKMQSKHGIYILIEFIIVNASFEMLRILFYIFQKCYQQCIHLLIELTVNLFLLCYKYFIKTNDRTRHVSY